MLRKRIKGLIWSPTGRCLIELDFQGWCGRVGSDEERRESCFGLSTRPAAFTAFLAYFPKALSALPCFWLSAQTRCPGQCHGGSSDTCSCKDLLSETTWSKIIFTSSPRLQSKVADWEYEYSALSAIFSFSLDAWTHGYNKSSLGLVPQDFHCSGFQKAQPDNATTSCTAIT